MSLPAVTHGDADSQKSYTCAPMEVYRFQRHLRHLSSLAQLATCGGGTAAHIRQPFADRKDHHIMTDNERNEQLSDNELDVEVFKYLTVWLASRAFKAVIHDNDADLQGIYAELALNPLQVGLCDGPASPGHRMAAGGGPRAARAGGSGQDARRHRLDHPGLRRLDPRRDRMASTRGHAVTTTTSIPFGSTTYSPRPTQPSAESERGASHRKP